MARAVVYVVLLIVNCYGFEFIVRSMMSGNDLTSVFGLAGFVALAAVDVLTVMQMLKVRR